MALVSALGAENDYQWCMSPACKSGQIHDDAEAGPIMTCNHCGFRSCVLHQVPFHEGETCSQYDDRMNRLRDGLHGRQQAQPEPSERSPVAGGKRKRGYAEPEDAEPRANQRDASSREMSSAISLMNLGPISTPGGKRQRLQEQRPEEQRQAEEQKRAKEKLKEEMASQNTLKLYRRCPGENCGYMVEKTGGCDHITCKITQDTARSTHHSSVLTGLPPPQAANAGRSSATSAASCTTSSVSRAMRHMPRTVSTTERLQLGPLRHSGLAG
jgi:hypothetical protein